MALVMAQMPDVWRKVLAEHVADPTGRCAACRNANGETASWPCQTYRVAQEARWVSEGNLPGTGPHGTGVNASPRVSPPSQPFPATAARPYEQRPSGPGYDLPASGGFGYDLPAPGGYAYDTPHGSGPGYYAPAGRGYGYDAPSGQGHGYDLPSTGGYGADAPSTGGYGGVEGYGGSPSSGTGGYDAGPGYGFGSGVGADPHADDAATAFGSGDGNAPALASLPPLPPTTPEPGRARHGSSDYYGSSGLGSSDRRSSAPDPYGPYGSPSYGAPYAEPDPLSAPSPGFSSGAGFAGPGFGEGPGFSVGDGFGASPGYSPDPGYSPSPKYGPSPGYGADPGSGAGHADPVADDRHRRRSWSGDESRPYGAAVDAPYGSTFGVDDRPRGSHR